MTQKQNKPYGAIVTSVVSQFCSMGYYEKSKIGEKLGVVTAKDMALSEQGLEFFILKRVWAKKIFGKFLCEVGNEQTKISKQK